MESQHGSNLKNIRKKRATAQQSIVSLSCLVCIAFAAIWGFHAGSGNSRAVEAKKMSASSSVAENESFESKADSSSQAESKVDESGIDESFTDSSVTHDDADDLSDAVFIGDSRTVGLQNNCDKPKATFLCSVGMHIDTVMTDQNITLSNGNAGTVIDALGERQYGRVYINLGTNELGWPYIDTFKDYYTQLITKIQEIQPDAVIYAESILPVTASRSLQGDAINNTNVATFNQAISEVAQQTGINYLDCTSAVAGADGTLAVMCIGTAALTGCGSDSDSSTANSANSAAAAQTNESVDVTAVADKLKNGIEFKDELAELDEAKIEKIIGISADSYTKAKVYVSSSGGTAEEIDCFEAKDADSAKAIADTLTARVESQKKVFENYVPEEMTKLGDPVLVTNGNYVYLCLSNDNDKAKEIIG